jgi:broad specificity phosphatase PhoE
MCVVFCRFPGGESYRDLMSRLTSVVIDVEQEVVPTLVVSHVSILQCLMAYFRNTRVEQCMSIEVPLHTVVKFTPVRGGGWSESHHPLYDVAEEGLEGPATVACTDSVGNLSQWAEDRSHSGSCSSLPIWGDSIMVVSPRPPLAKRISH